jgi:hypothetical protein
VGKKSSGKKKSGRKRSGAKRRTGPRACSECKNFKSGKKGGWCSRKEKKRAPDAEPCGHFDPR